MARRYPQCQHKTEPCLSWREINSIIACPDNDHWARNELSEAQRVNIALHRERMFGEVFICGRSAPSPQNRSITVSGQFYRNQTDTPLVLCREISLDVSPGMTSVELCTPGFTSKRHVDRLHAQRSQTGTAKHLPHPHNTCSPITQFESFVGKLHALYNDLLVVWSTVTTKLVTWNAKNVKHSLRETWCFML